jgi:hypothetical protein
VLVVTVVTAVACVPSEAVAGEENDRDNEHDPGDDGDPRRTQKDSGGSAEGFFCDWSRCGCGSRPHGGGFRCFTHETHDAWVNSSGGYALLM